MLKSSHWKPGLSPNITPGGDRILILQYANNTLIFIRASQACAEWVIKILHLYGEEAKQWTNLMKSSLTCSLNTNRQCIAEVRAALGIQCTISSFTNLGQAIGINNNSLSNGGIH